MTISPSLPLGQDGAGLTYHGVLGLGGEAKDMWEVPVGEDGGGGLGESAKCSLRTATKGDPVGPA